MCADQAEWSGQIQRYNNSPPYVTVNMADGQYGCRPIALRDPIPPFKFLVMFSLSLHV